MLICVLHSHALKQQPLVVGCVMCDVLFAVAIGLHLDTPADTAHRKKVDILAPSHHLPAPELAHPTHSPVQQSLMHFALPLCLLKAATVLLVDQNMMVLEALELLPA